MDVACDPITNQEDAEAPVLTALLPVKGLRRDASGNLTIDSINTVIEAVKSLGVVIDSDSTKLAVLQEARVALCKLNGQFQYTLKNLVSMISRSEMTMIDPKIFDTLKNKNQDMQDVLSVSRFVLNMDLSTFKEGFLGTVVDPFSSMREAFQSMATTVANNADMIRTGQYAVAEERTLDISREKNEYAARLTNLYGLMNVTAIGLLFYIMYAD
jgi:hypothetical protein